MERLDVGSDPRIPALWPRTVALVAMFGACRLKLTETRIALDAVARTAADPEVCRLAREASSTVRRALQEINGASVFPVGRFAVLLVRRLPWYARPLAAPVAAAWAALAVGWAVLRAT